jgi:threonyl-tRNA synthetase
MANPLDEEITSSDFLSRMRHTTAHVMAQAVREIFPDAKMGVGPVIEDGFYYDFVLPRPLTQDDLPAIEARMARIVSENLPLTRFVEERRGRARPVRGDEPALQGSVGGRPAPRRGDLVLPAGRLRGPVPRPAYRIHGAHRGVQTDEHRGRVLAREREEPADDAHLRHGLAKKEPLRAYLERLEEAKKRDHRTIGKSQRLFVIDEAVGQGLILWTPAGATIRQELQNFIAGELRKAGLPAGLHAPHRAARTVQNVGPLPYYRESQYPPVVDRPFLDELAKEGATCGELSNRLETGDVEGYLLKPMNCPHHIKIFASQPHSYRDLPVRLAEFGTVYRWEQSGELNGMTRVRGFTQDDAHLFCTEEQVADELMGCLALVKTIFTTSA